MLPDNDFSFDGQNLQFFFNSEVGTSKITLLPFLSSVAVARNLSGEVVDIVVPFRQTFS